MRDKVFMLYLKNKIESILYPFLGRRSNFVGRQLKFPWERASTKNLFYDYNKFEKVPQNDTESDQNENA